MSISVRLAWLAALGAIGTLARYGLSLLVQRLHPSPFPWGTLAVNALGCFLFGLVWTLAVERALISADTRILVLMGFMGAFTTFSSYAFETSAMLRDAEWMLAAGNLLAQNTLGIALFFVGVVVARML